MSLEYMSLWSLQPINFSVSYFLGITIHLMRRNVVQHGVALQGIPDLMENWKLSSCQELKALVKHSCAEMQQT